MLFLIFWGNPFIKGSYGVHIQDEQTNPTDNNNYPTSGHASAYATNINSHIQYLRLGFRTCIQSVENPTKRSNFLISDYIIKLLINSLDKKCSVAPLKNWGRTVSRMVIKLEISSVTPTSKYSLIKLRLASCKAHSFPGILY